MSWIILLIAGLLEIVWAVGLKYTEGFTKLAPTIITVSAMIFSVALLGLAVRVLPLGTAYAVWTGIGTVGTVIFGIMVLGESASLTRIGCIASIILGTIGLKIIATS